MHGDLRRGAVLPPPKPSRCRREANLFEPVFYGVQEYDVGVTKQPIRILYPSLVQGGLSEAPIVSGCGSFPLIMFARGECSELDHSAKWVPVLRTLAQAGFVVVISGENPDEPLKAAEHFIEALDWMYSLWKWRSLLLPIVGFAGHSTGAGVAAYAIQNLTAPVQVMAFAAMAGVYREDLKPSAFASPAGYGARKSLLSGLGALPALFMSFLRPDAPPRG